MLGWDRNVGGLAARSWAVVVAVLCIGAGGVARAQDITLRLHHLLPQQSVAQVQFLQPWADKVMAESGGRLKVEIYPSMQLGGKPAQLFDQARDGVVDLVWTVPSYTPGRFPTIEVFELPFVTASAEATSQAVTEFATKYAREEFAGVHPLVFHVHAPGSLHLASRPVARLEDMTGLKLRAPHRPGTEALSALGAVPVGMPAPEVTQSLARGVVDGTLFPFEVVLPLRVHEVTRFHTRLFAKRGLYTVVIALLMNQARYDSLPPDLKAVIDANSGLAVAKWVGQVFDKAEQPGIDAALAKGNRLITLDQAELDRWEQATRPVVDRWVADSNARGLEGQALLDEARALVAKYDSAN